MYFYILALFFRRASCAPSWFTSSIIKDLCLVRVQGGKFNSYASEIFLIKNHYSDYFLS
jgi:hypothetical protein